MSWNTEKIYTNASEIAGYLGLTAEEEKQMQEILEFFSLGRDGQRYFDNLYRL